jgi:hypothetical protein
MSKEYTDSLTHYQKIIVCTICGKKFRTLHELRTCCTKCRPPTTAKQRKLYRDLARKKIGVDAEAKDGSH